MAQAGGVGDQAMEHYWAKQGDAERAARARQLRPGRITAYRELLARQRVGMLSTRDAVALEGLRELLRTSGGVPDDEDMSATPSADEFEKRG